MSLVWLFYYSKLEKLDPKFSEFQLCAQVHTKLETYLPPACLSLPDAGRTRSERDLADVGAGGAGYFGEDVGLGHDLRAVERRRAWTMPSQPPPFAKRVSEQAVMVLAVKPGEDGRGGDNAHMRGFAPALHVAQVGSGGSSRGCAMTWKTSLNANAFRPQFFGLLPVSKPADVRRASFRWRSPRTVLAVVIISGAVLEAYTAALRMMDTGIKVNTSGRPGLDPTPETRK